MLAVVRHSLVVLCVLGCGGGGAPVIGGLADQVATVGSELVVQIDGSDPDGDDLTYGVKADISLQGRASMTQDPSGAGVFRWTPLADDIGVHAFDFTASDGANTTTVTIQIDVRSAVGAVPIFRRPLGSGTVIDPGVCSTVEILIEDADTAAVNIAEEPVLIDGAILSSIDGTMASWEWCPTVFQAAAADRYTLRLSADDGENPKSIKDFVLVLRSNGGGKIVINEVDYDNVGIDTAEYIELFNPSSAPFSLAGLAIVLVNGSTGAPYDTIDLSSAESLAPGGYLVIAGPNVDVASGAKLLDPVWSQDQIQNGAPDGVALIDTVTLTVLDALSYEGSVTAAMIPEFSTPPSLVEGEALPAATADSSTVDTTLCRNPNGSDTDQAAADWVICASPTPGAPNAP
jgi:hypothetical protein